MVSTVGGATHQLSSHSHSPLELLQALMVMCRRCDLVWQVLLLPGTTLMTSGKGLLAPQKASERPLSQQIGNASEAFWEAF